MGYGGSHTTKIHSAQLIGERREYSPDEMSELLTLREVFIADQYQLSQPIEQLADQPLPPELKKTNPLGYAALTDNVTDFDMFAPGTEELIDNDLLLQLMRSAKLSGEKGPLMRSRHAILGYMALKSPQEQSDVA